MAPTSSIKPSLSRGGCYSKECTNSILMSITLDEILDARHPQTFGHEVYIYIY
uniref:Uncharacterized protein n=1 Tax=Anguilla anguilla TaxID=7936 RepID=A0A0E9W520_ANGAN